MESWRDEWQDVQVAFLGRPTSATPAEALAGLPESPEQCSWLRQIHSSSLISAEPGFRGEADGLFSQQTDLALTVFTADCVPLLLASNGQIAAVHVGWRGFVAGIVDEALDILGQASRLRAWIGPSIGPCCYEVGEDVAAEIEARAQTRLSHPGPGGRPHVDLAGAVEATLESAGTGNIRRLQECTSCREDQLCSYRRDGAGAGRNYSFIWRRS